MIFLSITSLLGFILQVIIIYILTRSWRSDNYLTLLLFFSGAFISLAMFIKSILLTIKPKLLQNESFCQLSGFLFAFPQANIYLCLMFVFVNPFLYILCRKRPLTPNKMIFINLFILTSALGYACLPLFRAHYQPDPTGMVCWVSIVNALPEIKFFYILTMYIVLVNAIFIPFMTFLIWFKMERDGKKKVDQDKSQLQHYQWMIAKKGFYLTLANYVGLAITFVNHVYEFTNQEYAPLSWQLASNYSNALCWVFLPLVFYRCDQGVSDAVGKYLKCLNLSFRQSSGPVLDQTVLE